MPSLAEARAGIEQWMVDPERRFMTGADLRGYLTWHGVNLDTLSPGELIRLAALVRVFEAFPGKAAKMPTFAIWLVVGPTASSGGQRDATADAAISSIP